MSNLSYIGALLMPVVLLLSCDVESPMEPTTTGDPPISMQLSIDGSNLSFDPESHRIISSYQQNDQGVYGFSGTTERLDCDTDCATSISIKFYDSHIRDSSYIDIDQVLTPSFKQFVDLSDCELTVIRAGSYTGFPPISQGTWLNGETTPLGPEFEVPIAHIFEFSQNTHYLGGSADILLYMLPEGFERFPNLEVCLESNPMANETMITFNGIGSSEDLFAQLTVLNSTSTTEIDITESIRYPSDSIAEVNVFVKSKSNASIDYFDFTLLDLGLDQWPERSCLRPYTTDFSGLEAADYLSKVSIIYTDEHGDVYRSQPSYLGVDDAAWLEIKEVEPFSDNALGNPTRRLTLDFACDLIDHQGRTISTSCEDAIFTVAFPR